MRIVGVGDNVLDRYIDQGLMYPGGNAVNVPVLALRFGAEAAAYVGTVGDDMRSLGSDSDLLYE